jgi:hypothetical protein
MDGAADTLDRPSSFTGIDPETTFGYLNFELISLELQQLNSG